MDGPEAGKERRTGVVKSAEIGDKGASHINHNGARDGRVNGANKAATLKERSIRVEDNPGHLKFIKAGQVISSLFKSAQVTCTYRKIF